MKFTLVAMAALTVLASDVLSVGGHPPSTAAAQEYLLPAPVPPRASCNSVVNQGSDNADTLVIDVSGTTGTVGFQYNTYSQPDRMLVMIDGRPTFDTTCVGTEGLLTQNITLPPGAQKLQVRVEPNCLGTTGTTWSFKLLCPTP